jgi:disulfide oxidoreductase YuzD
MTGGFSAEAKREAVLREIKQRERVYPRLVADGKITADFARRQIAIMESIAEDYAEGGLFD